MNILLADYLLMEFTRHTMYISQFIMDLRFFFFEHGIEKIKQMNIFMYDPGMINLTE